MSVELPSEYIVYVEQGGLTEGFTQGEEVPGYFVLWPLDEIKSWNKDYQVDEYAPGFLGFGSNGGGEMLAFDASGAVFALPFVGMEPEVATQVADSWRAFVHRVAPPESTGQ